MRDWSTEERPAATVPSTGTLPPGATTTTSPGLTSARGRLCVPSPRLTRTVSGRKAMRSVRASLPRSLERSSRISAASTKAAITRDVTHSPMALAATTAMSIDSSMLIFRWRRSSHASAAIGQQPTASPTTATAGHRRSGQAGANAVTAAHSPVKRVRAASARSIRRQTGRGSSRTFCPPSRGSRASALSATASGSVAVMGNPPSASPREFYVPNLRAGRLRCVAMEGAGGDER